MGLCANVHSQVHIYIELDITNVQDQATAIISMILPIPFTCIFLNPLRMLLDTELDQISSILQVTNKIIGKVTRKR